MALPVGRIDAGVGNGISAVDHHPITDIDSNVRRTSSVIGFFKKDQVTIALKLWNKSIVSSKKLWISSCVLSGKSIPDIK